MDDELNVEDRRHMVTCPATDGFGCRCGDVPLITNQERADRIAKATEAAYDTLDATDCITDLLTDIRHYCHQHDLDFYALSDLSYKHYLEELKEQS